VACSPISTNQHGGAIACIGRGAVHDRPRFHVVAFGGEGPLRGCAGRTSSTSPRDDTRGSRSALAKHGSRSLKAEFSSTSPKAERSIRRCAKCVRGVEKRADEWFADEASRRRPPGEARVDDAPWPGRRVAHDWTARTVAVRGFAEPIARFTVLRSMPRWELVTGACRRPPAAWPPPCALRRPGCRHPPDVMREVPLRIGAREVTDARPHQLGAGDRFVGPAIGTTTRCDHARSHRVARGD